MDKKKSSSGRALVRTVAGNQLGDAIFDLAEVALDQNLAEGVLKDVPIVGSLVKLARAGQSVSEELFLRKLARFLADLNSVPVEERERLLEKYPDASEEQRVLGENLLLALERLDDVKKPAILARFFAAYIRSKIDYFTFTRLARALEKFNIELLPNLRWFYTREGPAVENPEEIIHELSLAGLVTVSLEESGTIDGSASYRNSELGKTFLLIGFDVQFSAR
ncbi:MAG: hypothetical protein Q8K62_06455 [Thiobacillus sp.]|nr:hypothetical protein [Sulfuritalea sp.]MDP1928137.1 hypothetical protein [Thiobacillus sp.]